MEDREVRGVGGLLAVDAPGDTMWMGGSWLSIVRICAADVSVRSSLPGTST